MQELTRRRLTGWSALLLLLSLVPLLALPAAGDEEKIVICHAAGQDGTTQYVTLELPRNAVYGQAGHFYENGTPQAGHEEDSVGPCEEGFTETTVESEEPADNSDDDQQITVPPDNKVADDPAPPAEESQDDIEPGVGALVATVSPVETPAAVPVAPLETAAAAAVAVAAPAETLPMTGTETTTSLALGAAILAAGAFLLGAGHERKIGRHEAR